METVPHNAALGKQWFQLEVRIWTCIEKKVSPDLSQASLIVRIDKSKLKFYLFIYLKNSKVEYTKLFLFIFYNTIQISR